MYLDPKAQAAITGAPVTIGDTPGAAFEAFDGMLSGTMLTVVKPRLIVQSWRSISFTPEDKAGRIDLIHLDVPEQDYDGVNHGWEQYYWTPWREYLEQQNV